MGQCWNAAVAAAGEAPPVDLPGAIAEELIALWSDLAEAMRRAGSRSWSVECDGLVVRIVMLTRLTAATSWQWIPAALLTSGIYQGVLQSAGISFAAPCLAEIDGMELALGPIPLVRPELPPGSCPGNSGRVGYAALDPFGCRCIPQVAAPTIASLWTFAPVIAVVEVHDQPPCDSSGR